MLKNLLCFISLLHVQYSKYIYILSTQDWGKKCEKLRDL